MTEARVVGWEKPYYTKVDCVRQQTNAIATQDLTDEQIEIFIFSAQSIIDAELGTYFSVPFSPENLPPIIETIACQLASSLVLRKLYTGEADNKSEHEEPLWTQAMDMLKKLKDGEMMLIDKNGNSISPRDYIKYENYEDIIPVFGQEFPDREV